MTEKPSSRILSAWAEARRVSRNAVGSASRFASAHKHTIAAGTHNALNGVGRVSESAGQGLARRCQDLRRELRNANAVEAREGRRHQRLQGVGSARPLLGSQLAKTDIQAVSTSRRLARAVQGRSRASRNLPYAAPLQPGHAAVPNASRLPLPRRNQPQCLRFADAKF
jgi:hypothetical protein